MRLVLIEWLDSGQPVAAWRYLDDIADVAHRCQTVGHLVREDKETMVIAMSVATTDTGHDWGQAAGVMTIPTRSVLRVAELTSSSVLGPACPEPE